MKLLLLIFSAALASAQTQINLGQIKACGAASGIQIWLSFPTGTPGGGVTCITLDPNIFRMNGNTLTILLPSSSASFVDGEVPTGAIDGTNRAFTLAAVPTPGSLRLYFNGLRLSQCDPAKPAAPCDFDLAGQQITFRQNAPFPSRATDLLIADYRK